MTCPPDDSGWAAVPQYDYQVVVPREAVADRNPSAHEANLLDLAAKYADVDSLAAVLGALGLAGQ